MQKNGFATVLTHELPAPTPPTPIRSGLVDAQGGNLQSPTLVEKMGEKMAEPVTLSKGMLWLIGAAVVIANLMFLYGGSLVSWAREDQTQKVNIIQIQADMNRMSEAVDRLDQKFGKIDDRLREQERFIDKTTGFKAGVAEAQSDK